MVVVTTPAREMEPPHDQRVSWETMNETIQAIVDLVTAVGVIYLAVRMERFRI